MTKQTFPSTVQIAGDLGGTPASPQVTGAHFGGSDGQYMIRRSGLWAPATPSYADLSSIPASFTPSAHASTHDVGGADVLKDLSRLAAGPAMYGYIAWTFDPYISAGNNYLPVAGTIYLHKILTAHAYTINAVDLIVSVAGTGVTALANCFLAIFDSGGTRRFLSSDQSSAWASVGSKPATVSGGYTVTANDFIYIAVLVGTQSTTAVQFTGTASLSVQITQTNLTAATYRMAQNGTSQSAIPGSLTLSSNATSAPNKGLWAGVR